VRLKQESSCFANVKLWVQTLVPSRKKETHCKTGQSTFNRTH
jgi:hypothetical protein